MTNSPVVHPATELKPLVEDMILDPRMVGLAKYIVKIDFFWSPDIPTACAGHGFIFFNQDFFYSIPEETRMTIIYHEIEHLVLRHLKRGKECIPSIHNVAADHVINNALKAEGFTFDGIPFEICCDPKYKGMSTEQVYNILVKEAEKNPPPLPTFGQMSADQIEDMVEAALGVEKTLEEQAEKAEGDIQSLEKRAGKNTGGKRILLEPSKKNIIVVGATYEEVFEKYLIDPLGATKRSFARPNRRQHGRNVSLRFRLPGRIKRSRKENRLTHLVYALDVSGSVTLAQAQQFHDSVRTIKKILKPEFLTVLFFDTKIKLEKTFSANEPYGGITVQAGGGTDLKDVYKRVAEINPEALVIFTDMQVNIPKQPTWETIWLVPFMTSVLAPYGKMYLIPKT